MNIKNPCIGLCKFDESTQLCKGCLRTRDERKAWKSLSEQSRIDIVADRPKREPVLEAALAFAGKPEKVKTKKKKKEKTKAEKKAKKSKKAKKKAKRLAKKKDKTKR